MRGCSGETFLKQYCTYMQVGATYVTSGTDASTKSTILNRGYTFKEPPLLLYCSKSICETNRKTMSIPHSTIHAENFVIPDDDQGDDMNVRTFFSFPCLRY